MGLLSAFGADAATITQACMALNGQYVAPPGAPIAPPVSSVFTRDLELGASGEDVRALQHFLNTHGFPVNLTVEGSLGKETLVFGPATQAALIKFQTARGIVPAAGYFGPKTRAVVAATP
jgi:peptidoglycan hydrolase-like protein with peptidoglycan-binding domain